MWLEGRDLIESPVWHNRTDTIISVMGTVGVGLSSFLLILLEMAIVSTTPPRARPVPLNPCCLFRSVPGVVVWL